MSLIILSGGYIHFKRRIFWGKLNLSLFHGGAVCYTRIVLSMHVFVHVWKRPTLCSCERISTYHHSVANCDMLRPLII